MNLEEVNYLRNDLELLHDERKDVRRHLLKFLRNNYEIAFPQNEFESQWLKRKIRRNYLGDLSDKQIRYYVTKTYDQLKLMIKGD